MKALKRDSYVEGSAKAVDGTAFREQQTGSRFAKPTGIDGVLTDANRLTSGIECLRSNYRSAKPYPYLILDDLFSEKLLERVISEMPPPGEASWVRHDDDHLRQFNLRSAIDLGNAGSQLVAFLHSARFLYFLSEVTGIWDLLPDPYLQGGGYHVIPQGGKFDVHVDRNTHYSTELIRRLSLLIYLNKDWKREYCGQLELWSNDGKRPEVTIEPTFNRTALLEIGDENYHGVPSVVKCPEGRHRLCFVAYYHTLELPGVKEVTPHTSIYAPILYRQRRSRLRQLAKDLPPHLCCELSVNYANHDIHGCQFLFGSAFPEDQSGNPPKVRISFLPMPTHSESGSFGAVYGSE